MATELDENSVRLFHRTRAATISVLALYVYEYIITLYDEIRYVWKHKYSFATILFAFNRYAVWLEIALQLYTTFGDLTTVNQCTRINKALSVIIGCHKLCIGLFCSFRVFAIWDRSWSVFWTIMLLYIAHTAIFLTPGMLSDYTPIGPPFYGCKMEPKAMRENEVIQLQLAASGLTIFSDATILGLTIMRTMTISVDARKFGFKTPVASLLLRDGTVYFVALTITSTTNIVTIKMGPSSPINGIIALFIHPLRTILITRFFLNLRHVFFKKDRNSPESISSIRIMMPTIASEDLVGNLGAPLRNTFTSGPRSSTSSSEISTGASSGSSLRQRQKFLDKGKVRAGADPLLDWDVDDLDDEDLEDVEVTSHRPMLFGLEIDPNVRGGGSGKPLWRKEFDGIGVEGEEAISLMDRNGTGSAAQTPIRSAHSHPKGVGNRSSLPPSRKPTKSTVDEGDALLADADENYEDPDEYLRDQMRSSMASTVNSGGPEVSPRRSSYFS